MANTPNKPRILIIDNDDHFRKNCTDELRPYADVMESNLNRAVNIFTTGEFDYILIDGNEKLVKLIRSTFSGPLIASSANAEFNDLMFNAGCSHTVNKEAAINFILNHLDASTNEYPVVPVKKSYKEKRLEFVNLMLEFLTAARDSENLEKAKELFSRLETLTKQKHQMKVVCGEGSIRLLLKDLEQDPQNSITLANLYCEMINIYSLTYQ